VLKILELNPFTYYYSISKGTEEKEENGGRPIPGYSYTFDGRKVCYMQIKEWIMELIEGDGFGYGYYKLTMALRKQYKLIINKKKVYRLCKELGILKPQREIKPKHPGRLAKNRIVTAPNQLWEADIKYGYIAGEDRFFYVLSIIDIYDRMVVDYHIGLSCEGSDAAITLQRALMHRNLYEKEDKPVIRTDNGPQFISHAFESRCEELKVEHERIPLTHRARLLVKPAVYGVHFRLDRMANGIMEGVFSLISTRIYEINKRNYKKIYAIGQIWIRYVSTIPKSIPALHKICTSELVYFF